MRLVACALVASGIYMTTLPASAYEIRNEEGFIVNAGQNDFAPYYFSAMNFGTLTQSKNAILKLGLFHAPDSSRRFSHSWGIEAYAGASSTAPYDKWVAEGNTGHWEKNNLHTSSLWLQQLYGEIRYRRIYLQVGIKPHGSKMLDNKLTSGDLVWSGNTRPMPEVRAGFIDYVDIPLTKKWVQIEGVISYNWMDLDKDWNIDQYNYFNQLMAYDRKMCFKRISFRTNPTKPFHVVASAQNASMFGGTTVFYYNGINTRTYHNSSKFKDYLEAFLPLRHGGTGDEYYHGDNKGSWNFQANYRFRNSDQLSAYFEWFWEDGSGMAKRNGWDGLWGVQYRFNNCKWINSALVEYIDLTNMSGPLTWYQPDTPDSSLTSGTTGADNYYNNSFVGPYTYYGHNIGTPVVMGSVYQLNGAAMINLNRVRGIHVAACGKITDDIDWLVKFGYRKGWGPTGSYYLLHPMHLWSAMAECEWHPEKVKGLSVKAQIGFDRGTMPQNTFGALIGVTFDRTFFQKKSN